jgi:hypothetical protein
MILHLKMVEEIASFEFSSKSKFFEIIIMLIEIIFEFYKTNRFAT